MILNIAFIKSYESGCYLVLLYLAFFYAVVEIRGLESWLRIVDSLCSSTYRVRIYALGLSDSRYVQLSIVGIGKKLLHRSMLFMGHAWVICNLLGEDSTDTYAYLKGALLHCLSPNTEQDCLVACEQFSKFQEGRKGKH